LAHGWAEQSPAHDHATICCIEGRFAYLAERGVDEPSGDSALPAPRPSGQRLRRCSLRRPASASDNFVWNKIGQPKAGPVARSAKGFGPWMGRTIPPRTITQPDAASKAFCVSGGERWWTNPSFDKFGWRNLDSRRLAP
jgi:hypothetical protein